MREPKAYRCGHCLDETGNTDGAVFTRAELAAHPHGTKWYWPIDETWAVPVSRSERQRMESKAMRAVRHKDIGDVADRPLAS